MLTTEQKAWQLHENGVTFGDLAMIVNCEAWDFDNPNGIKGFTMDDAVNLKWKEMFSAQESVA